MAKFKKGDKVRLVNTMTAKNRHIENPEYYPEPGTVGTVYATDPDTGAVKVEWPQDTVMGPNYTWWAPNSLLELIENAAPDYYIRVTATSEHDAKVEVNGPAGWVHKALAQTIMKINPQDPFGVLAAVLTHALNAEEDEEDGTE